PGWSRRYGARIDTWRLPTTAAKRAELAAAYGTDARVLLRAVGDAGAPAWLRALPAVEVLRRVLVQNYLITTDAAGREVIRAREADTDGLPPGRVRLSSPYDTDARWAAKGDDLSWNGYKVHITETCQGPDAAPGDDPGGGDDPGRQRPNIIVGVATTDATVPDARMTDPIHAALARRCPPSTTSTRATRRRRWSASACAAGGLRWSPRCWPISLGRPKTAPATTGPASPSTSTPNRRSARRARPAPGGARPPSAAPTQS
ncbi:MAG: hypothetical protein LC799_07585, partial [Actinobacteria bacterium]|nr:hypothetical protein [Actinomycetota bacterium]